MVNIGHVMFDDVKFLLVFSVVTREIVQPAKKQAKFKVRIGYLNGHRLMIRKQSINFYIRQCLITR